MTIALAVTAALAAGYALCRYQPARRISDWANWQRHNRSLRRHSARWWAAWLVLSAENIGWLVTHPRKGLHAWKHRNDPPHREPAPTPDPNWAENRRRAAKGQP